MNQPEQGKILSDLWRTTGSRNPYLHHGLAMLGLHPDDDVETIREKMDEIEGRLEAGHELLVHDEPVQFTDISRVDGMLGNTQRFVAERLLIHTPHEVDLTSLSLLGREIESALFDDPVKWMPLEIVDFGPLLRLLPESAPEGPAPPFPQLPTSADLSPDSAEEEPIYDL